MAQQWDVVIVGAGTTGMVAAIFASRRGARVLLLESAADIGGTLHISGGNMSAAGTKLQKGKNIADSVQEHYDDVMRICHNTADPKIVRLAVEHAADTFDWLTDSGMPLDPVCPQYNNGAHEPYLIKRYAWGPEYGKSIYKALVPMFFAEVTSGGVTLKLSTRVTGLIQDPRTRAVTGVRTKSADGVALDYHGQNILVATGGYAASPQMVARIHGTPLYSNGSMPEARGEGIEMIESVGGYLRGGDYFHCNFGVVLNDYDYPSKTIGRVVTMPEVRQPWEIYVDSRGNRFLPEDEPSVDKRERALVALPDKRYWVVFDGAILKEAPPVMERWSREQVTAALGNHPMFLKANSLAELAAQAGMDAPTLEASVKAYNDNLKGTDPLGRKHRPRPIGSGPFYAIRQHATIIVSTAGITVDGDLRVVDRQGRPIPNLYAAGEVIGSVATMGDAAANGMLVTPALTFGRLLGDRMLKWEKQRAAAE